MSKPIYTAAVIGCGNIGMLAEADKRRLKPATHAGAFARHKRIRLAGLCDTDETKRAIAATLFPKADFFTDPKIMLQETAPDIVAIATHPDSHKELLELCLGARVNAVMCEKPLAPSVADGEAMLALAKRYPKALVFVNHMRRFDPVLANAKAHIGRIGNVLQGACYYTKGIRNNGTHIIDLLRYFLGDVAWVYAVPGNATFALPGDENLDGLLKFRSGALVSLHALEDRAYGIHDLNLYGTNGALRVTRYGFEVEWRGVRPNRDFKNFNELTLPKIEGTKRSFFAPMAEHIVRCLDGKETPRSTLQDGLAALRVIEALIQSAKTGERIVISH